MESIRFMAAGGAVGGAGVNAELVDKAVDEFKPHFLAQDGGSTDPGPYYLGSGNVATARASLKRDLLIIISAALRANVPVIVGSVGTAGGDVHVEWTLQIVREIVSEMRANLRVAVIYAEQDKDYLKGLYRTNRIRPLPGAPAFDEDTISRSSRIVGMMGVEQIQRALEGGAQLVLAGRCSDAALFAAKPIMDGFPHGLSWHAGKLLECGTMACENPGNGIIMADLNKDSVVISALGPGLRCTPNSLAGHSLYENSDPYLHYECAGVLDLSDSSFEAVDDKSVRIRGSKFRHSDDYTVKLEGAELAGYQAVMVGGIRDPFIIAELDKFLDGARTATQRMVERVFAGEVSRDSYSITYRAYGRDAVMGEMEPNRDKPGHELGLVMEITAPTRELAKDIAILATKQIVHYPIDKWNGLITGIALLHNPPYLERGPVYRFNVNHVALPHDPHEMFRTEFVDLA